MPIQTPRGIGYDYREFDASKAMEMWSETDRMDYEERAAVLEYEGGFERKKAEFRAFWEVERARRARER